LFFGIFGSSCADTFLAGKYLPYNINQNQEKQGKKKANPQTLIENFQHVLAVQR